MLIRLRRSLALFSSTPISAPAYPLVYRPRSFLSPQSFHPISLTHPFPSLPFAFLPFHASTVPGCHPEPKTQSRTLTHAAVMAALSESIKVVLMRLNYRLCQPPAHEYSSPAKIPPELDLY